MSILTPAMITAERREEILAMLTGAKCRCGAKKRGGRALCDRCFTKLPVKMKLSLFKRSGKGFEEAFETVEKFLDQ